ncbi:MAG: hypothetical protein R6T98_04540 [Desulfatiglandales bacterium]
MEAVRWDNPNRNRDRYRDRRDMALGHEKLDGYRLSGYQVREDQAAYSVDFDPDSDFDPEERKSHRDRE